MNTDRSDVWTSFKSPLLRDILLILALTAMAWLLSVWFKPFRAWFGSSSNPFDDLILGSLVPLIGIGAVSVRAWFELERFSHRLRALYQTALIASSALDTKEVLFQMVEAIRGIMNYSHVVVMMIEQDRLIPMAWTGYSERPPELRLDQGVTGRVARTGELAYVPDVSKDPDFVSATYGTTSEIACPISVAGRTVGVLSVESVQNIKLMPDDVVVVRNLAAQLGLALGNAMQHEDTVERAIRDGLTGLYNHAYFHERMREEFLRARRYKHPLALIMLDLDDFKRFNDTYGHTQGDRILRLFAGFLRKGIRETDIVARYGGEEFVVIMPETGGPQAGIAAERLRRRIESDSPLYIGEVGLSLTASFGVASFPEDAEDAEDLIRQADEALYAAKNSGKNCVCARSWTPAAVSPKSGTAVATQEG